MTVHVLCCHGEAMADAHNSAGSPKWRPDISLEVPHVRRPLVVSGDTSEPVKGTGTDMTRKSIQETERRNYTRYTWECVSALLLTHRTLCPPRGGGVCVLPSVYPYKRRERARAARPLRRS